MKKISLFTLILIIFVLAGCSFKDKVTNIERKLQNVSASELAKMVASKKLPIEKNVRINGSLFIEKLYYSYSENEHLYLYLFLYRYKDVKELWDTKLGKHNTIYDICTKDTGIRAMLNKGVILTLKFSGYEAHGVSKDDKFSVYLDKEVCTKIENGIVFAN